MRCAECRRYAFLITGLCETCAPTVHAIYLRERQKWDALFERFRDQTGAEPLADWNRFERWCEANA